jgi:hypothetical protein
MSADTVRDLVRAWCVMMPAHPRPIQLQDGIAATARGTFLGQDTSDPEARGEDIYTETENLPTAMASILNHSQQRANFHPADTPPDLLAAAFTAYVREVDANPFLHLESSENDKQAFWSSDYNLLIDQVVNLYKGVTSEDLNEIKTAIADMAKSVFGQSKSEQWKNIFSQSVFDMSDLENPKFYLYYTSLHMKHEKDGKSEVSEQDYEVRATSYLVLPELIKAHADSLAKLDRKSVDDWMSAATSPERDDPRLCFRTRPYRARASERRA